MNKHDLDRLWQLPWFHWNVRTYYGLDRRRHLRWDRHMRTIYYVVRRSAPRADHPGRFAVDQKTLDWACRMEDTGRVESARVVLVENWQSPPKIIRHGAALWLWDRLESIEPLIGTDDSRFWWVDDECEPQDAFIGPVLTKPPF